MASILLLLAVLLQLNVAAIEFIDPPDGYEFAVGEPTTITWKPVASNGTVTIELMWGAAIASDYGDVIASEIPDSGRFTWTPPDDVEDFDNYTICMYPDQPPQDFDCLPTFSIAGAGNSTSENPSVTPSSSPTSSPEPAPSDDSGPAEPGDNLPTAAKVGIGIGSGVGVVVVVFIGICWVRRRKQTAPRDQSILLHSHPNPSIAKNAHGTTMELHAHGSGPDISELVDQSIRELNSGTQQYPNELSGTGLRELDGGASRSNMRPPVELPTMERRFV